MPKKKTIPLKTLISIGNKVAKFQTMGFNDRKDFDWLDQEETYIPDRYKRSTLSILKKIQRKQQKTSFAVAIPKTGCRLMCEPRPNDMYMTTVIGSTNKRYPVREISLPVLHRLLNDIITEQKRSLSVKRKTIKTAKTIKIIASRYQNQFLNNQTLKTHKKGKYHVPSQ